MNLLNLSNNTLSSINHINNATPQQKYYRLLMKFLIDTWTMQHMKIY